MNKSENVPQTPDKRIIYYDMTDNTFKKYDGFKWVEVDIIEFLIMNHDIRSYSKGDFNND